MELDAADRQRSSRLTCGLHRRLTAQRICARQKILALRRIRPRRGSRSLHGHVDHDGKAQRPRSAGVAGRRSCPHRRHAEYQAGAVASVEVDAADRQRSTCLTFGLHRRHTFAVSSPLSQDSLHRGLTLLFGRSEVHANKQRSRVQIEVTANL